MKKTMSIAMLALLNLHPLAFASDGSASLKTPHSKAEFCAMAQDLKNFQTLSLNEQTHMAFQNQGGLAHGGVCWWHSALQRKAIYLAVFRPDLPKPANEQQVKNILDSLHQTNRVVEIPGYNNFEEFSSDNEGPIQRKLETWQKIDGFVKQKWIVGLSGSDVVSAKKLNKMMDNLYTDVGIHGLIDYQMLQIKGITSHAMLVTNMSKTADGYDFSFIDSNAPLGTEHYSYHRGDTSIGIYDGVVGYTQQEDDLKLIAIEILRYCNPKVAAGKYISALTELKQEDGEDSQSSVSQNHNGIEQAIRAAKKGKLSPYLRELTLNDDETYGKKFTQLMTAIPN